MWSTRHPLRTGLLLAPVVVGTLPGRTSPSFLVQVDTAARFTVVAEDVLQALGLDPIGATDVRTAMHDVAIRPVYKVHVGIEVDDEFGETATAMVPLTVIASPPPRAVQAPHRGLLGLDFLRCFHFTFDGPHRTWDLGCEQLP